VQAKFDTISNRQGDEELLGIEFLVENFLFCKLKKQL
jgi:hypothetical protein